MSENSGPISADDVRDLACCLKVSKPSRAALMTLQIEMELLDRNITKDGHEVSALALLSLIALLERFADEGWTTPGCKLSGPMVTHKDALVWVALVMTTERDDLQSMLEAVRGFSS